MTKAKQRITLLGDKYSFPGDSRISSQLHKTFLFEHWIMRTKYSSFWEGFWLKIVFMKTYSYAMANGKGKYGIDPRIACITSPLWKHSSGSSVVTLKMRPQATPFTSLDTFMAAHSPRRFCQTRQRYLLSKHTRIFSIPTCIFFYTFKPEFVMLINFMNVCSFRAFGLR